MEDFERYFDFAGWARTLRRDLEPGKRKIALYASLGNGQPTHAARQLENGLWTSKLGRDIDLSHELEELEGPTYGTVVAIFERSR